MLVKALARERAAILEQGIATGKEQGIEIGIVTGKEQGIEIGIATGKEIGKEIGIATGKEQRDRQIVQAMAQKGFTLSIIAEITQLSPTEIERFLKEDAADDQATL